MQEFLKTVAHTGKKIANKNLGQNFLKSEDFVNKIVESACVNAGNVVVEIGCGLGSLTMPILQKTKNFIGIEKDDGLFEYLVNSFPDGEFFNEDATLFNFEKVANHNTIIISNLPYNIGTKLVIKLGIEILPSIHSMVVMLQKDVVQKILAKQNSENYHQMGVFFQSFCDVTHVCDVPSSAFSPAPNVVSSVVRIVPNECGVNLVDFWDFLQKAFNFRRKTLGRIFPEMKCREFLQKRTEELSVNELMQVFKALKS